MRCRGWREKTAAREGANAQGKGERVRVDRPIIGKRRDSFSHPKSPEEVVAERKHSLPSPSGDETQLS